SNVKEASATLPKSVLAKGGAFISMYQREAMWVSFKLQNEDRKPLAVKVSVGVNALTGLAQNVSAQGKQDFLPISGRNGQLWLDGISTSPGVVRQFVAMPLGKGYTAEGQVTGAEVGLLVCFQPWFMLSFQNVGGIQIDVFPKYDIPRMEFGYLACDVNMYKTARQLGLKVGEPIQLTSRVWML
ncbi:hypothetical protein PAXINDRAFT_83873, partial [Paxillus involutus ATCC 200175]